MCTGRCGTCQHWKYYGPLCFTVNEDNPLGTPVDRCPGRDGVCQLLSATCGKTDFHEMACTSHDEDDAEYSLLDTRADFGCVLYQEREVSHMDKHMANVEGWRQLSAEMEPDEPTYDPGSVAVEALLIAMGKQRS